MQILILLAVIITRSIPGIWGVPAGWGVLCFAISIYLVGVFLIGLLDRLICSDLIRLTDAYRASANSESCSRDRDKSPLTIERVDNLIRKHGAFNKLQRFWLITGITVLNMLGLAQRVKNYTVFGNYPLVEFVIVLLPLVAAIVLVWILDYPFNRAVRYSYIRKNDASKHLNAPELKGLVQTLSQYLGLNFRIHLLFVAVPVCFIIFWFDCVDLYLEPYLSETEEMFILLSICAVVFIFSPIVLIRIWKTSPLPASNLRIYLEEMCCSAGVKYRQILQWHSGGTIANAAVIGMLKQLRYLLITDKLIDTMHPREIEAVFAHEIAHIKNRHLLHLGILSFVIVITCAILSTLGTWLIYQNHSAANFLRDINVSDSIFAAVTTVLFVLILWYKIVGAVSRLFERQADVFGAWMIGFDQLKVNYNSNEITREGAYTFADALIKLCDLNNHSVSRKNWRHGSIFDRTEYIHSLADNMQGKAIVDRKVKMVKIAIWIFFIAAAFELFILRAFELF